MTWEWDDGAQEQEQTSVWDEYAFVDVGVEGDCLRCGPAAFTSDKWYPKFFIIYEMEFTRSGLTVLKGSLTEGTHMSTSVQM